MTHSTAPRAYLIGLSTFQQQPLLGGYEQGKLHLNDCGEIVVDEWVRLATKRKGIVLDTWTITPNSLQSIVFVQMSSLPEPGMTESALGHKPWLLSSFIAGFKAAAAKRINLCLNQQGQPVWQRNYDEMLITDQARLNHLRDQFRGAVG